MRRIYCLVGCLGEVYFFTDTSWSKWSKLNYLRLQADEWKIQAMHRNITQTRILRNIRVPQRAPQSESKGHPSDTTSQVGTTATNRLIGEKSISSKYNGDEPGESQIQDTGDGSESLHGSRFSPSFRPSSELSALVEVDEPSEESQVQSTGDTPRRSHGFHSSRSLHTAGSSRGFRSFRSSRLFRYSPGLSTIVEGDETSET